MILFSAQCGWLLSSVVAAAFPDAARTETCPSAEYTILSVVANDKLAVNRINVTAIGPAADGMTEWQMNAHLATGSEFSVRAVSQRIPMQTERGPGEFARYLFRDSRGKVTEYRHKRTGKPLLPPFSFVQVFLPTCASTAPRRQGFAITGEYLGHAASLTQLVQIPPPPAWKVDFDLSLDPDMIVGILWSMKDDGTGQDEKSEYKYTALNEADYRELIEAGCNSFGAPPPEHRSLLQDRPVFFRLTPDFPEDFYRSNYAGMEHHVDEPAIHMRRTDQVPGNLYHPAQMADLLLSRVKPRYGRGGSPYAMNSEIRKKYPLGMLDLRDDAIPCWETVYESAFYELAAGSAGIVHEGRYQMVTPAWGWNPRALFGRDLDLSPEQVLRCHYATLRGAARAFGRSWGTSIYGQSSRDLREPALTLAYNMGARWFWFWSADHDHHLVHTEKLRLMRALRDYAKAHPRRGLAELRRAATTAIALPWGYTLAWDKMWDSEHFALDRVNAAGVPYRKVVSAATWEGILCSQRGEDFDFTIDHPGLDGLGYKWVVRVSEDGNAHSQPAP